jgi:hypothetical protein
MRILILCITLTWFLHGLQAQSVTSEIIAPNGGVDQARGITISWTLGEPTISYFTGRNQMYTEGFHQPVLQLQWISPQEVSPDVTKEMMAQIEEGSIQVYPNPTTAQLYMHLNLKETAGMKWMILHPDGQILLRGNITNDERKVEIDVSDFAAGAYTLQVLSGKDQPVAFYRITKIQ